MKKIRESFIDALVDIDEAKEDTCGNEMLDYYKKLVTRCNLSTGNCIMLAPVYTMLKGLVKEDKRKFIKEAIKKFEDVIETIRPRNNENYTIEIDKMRYAEMEKWFIERNLDIGKVPYVENAYDAFFVVQDIFKEGDYNERKVELEAEGL